MQDDCTIKALRVWISVFKVCLLPYEPACPLKSSTGLLLWVPDVFTVVTWDCRGTYTMELSTVSSSFGFLIDYTQLLDYSGMLV